ncbi:MAG: hypothetical protein LBU20_02460 [Candidatus Nomurabacteria bacterium]|jgi:hypothetical protein|nr:hypothetical protein [Candidatus Nomurabacteria bacterium]
MKSLNSIGQKFADELTHVNSAIEHQLRAAEDADKIHVTGVGATITKAYEQLRNASENSDEILLLQRAIRRFYKRLLLTPEKFSTSGTELISELTMAGYLENDSIAKTTADKISQFAGQFLELRKALPKTINGDKLNRYTIDTLSVKIESLLHNHGRELALSNLAYNYFIKAIDPEKLFDHKPISYEAMLLAATQKTILRYDDATVRHNLIARYGISIADAPAYQLFNQQLDHMFANHDSDVLLHFVDRRSAVFRVLNRQIDDNGLPKSLTKQDSFLNIFTTATSKSYHAISRSVNKGVWRSILFLIITKFIIGFAIEAPYDVLTVGAIVWGPLIINLLFPPVYMFILRLTLIMPGQTNSRELSREVDRILYSDAIDTIYINPKNTSAGFGKVYQIVYGLVVLAVACGVGYYLWTIGFMWVQLLIFFVFVSAASFLGFRLSRWIREIETIDGHQSLITTVRDLLYMPFVAIGRWVNEKYARINIVSRALDVIVELPLKTLLGWIRQWNNFLSAKKDEL